MKIKSLILGVSAASLLMGSSLAIAGPNLITKNTSGDYSSVKVHGTLGNVCSGTLGQWTGPGQPRVSTPWKIITSLCGKSSGTCQAILYLSPNKSGKTCQGPHTKVTMKLSNGSIQAQSTLLNGKHISTSKYALTIS